MNDALFVRRFERLGDLLRDGHRLVNRDRAVRDELRQVLAFDQFHHEGRDAPALFDAVDGGDVGMIQRGQGLGFALEAREPIDLVRERFGQDLDCDVAIQLRVTRAKDLAHPAFADRRGDLVDAEARARGESQCLRDYTDAGIAVGKLLLISCARGGLNFFAIGVVYRHQWPLAPLICSPERWTY